MTTSSSQARLPSQRGALRNAATSTIQPTRLSRNRMLNWFRKKPPRNRTTSREKCRMPSASARTTISQESVRVFMRSVLVFAPARHDYAGVAERIAPGLQAGQPAHSSLTMMANVLVACQARYLHRSAWYPEQDG